MIKVGVLGAKGRMGSEVCRTVEAAADLELAAAVDVGDARDPLAGCDVIVDFTHPGAVLDNLRWCLSQGRNVVVGTSGFDDARLAAVADWLGDAPSARALIVPNFSVGAVLMMSFAGQAARFFESAEVIELHHAAKVDAPSGTAVRTASLIAAARAAAELGPPPGRDGHRGRRGPGHGRGRGAGALGPAGRAAGAPGGAARRARRDPDHPARLAGPVIVHAGGTAGGAGHRGPATRPDGRAAGPARPDVRGEASR